MRPTRIVGLLIAAAAFSGMARGEGTVGAWKLPKGDFKPDARAEWKAASAGAALGNGGVLESKTLLVAAVPGAPGVAVWTKAEGGGKRVELSLVPAGANESAAIGKVEVARVDEAEASLRMTAGAATAEIAPGAGAPVVKVAPGKGAAGVEVKTGARYAILPDFFADDVVFDAAKFSAPRLTVPAENFLLQMPEGGRTIVMCIWQGSLKLSGATSKTNAAASASPATPAPAAPSPAAGESLDPQVDLFFAGEGQARRIAAGRIEFQSKPVCVGVLDQKDIWQDEDVSALEGSKSTAIAWKRPFEAKWRGDFIVAAGRSMSDWPTRHQSFNFRDTSDPKTHKWWERGDQSAPQIWQESLVSFFVYPAVFKGDETRLCLYVDKGVRGKADKATAEARKTDKNAPAVPYSNVYERVIIYPLDRVAGTPLTAYTPVDLMRETLGQGPCEYVLDLSGVKPRPVGGDRPILSYATCGLWMQHIFPITGKFKKKPEGGFEPLDEKTKAHLIQALEDMWYFVHAIHDRLREYKNWGADAADFCKQEGAGNAKVKPVADKVMVYVKRLNDDVGRLKFEGPGTEGFWKTRIEDLIAQTKEDKYGEVGTIGQIRNLGNYQDEMVSRCRQYVKGGRQEILLQDTSDPDVRKFATAFRDRCHQMLRNMHPKEGF